MERDAPCILERDDYSLRGGNAVIPCVVLPEIRFHSKKSEFSGLASETIQ